MSGEGNAAPANAVGAADGPRTAAERKALAALVFAMTPGPKTLRQIADHLDCSYERIRLIESRAMRKLRLRIDRNEWQQTRVPNAAYAGLKRSTSCRQ